MALFLAHKIFGITEKEMDELIKDFRHLVIDCDNMTDVIEKTILIPEDKYTKFRFYIIGKYVASNDLKNKKGDK